MRRLLPFLLRMLPAMAAALPAAVIFRRLRPGFAEGFRIPAKGG